MIESNNVKAGNVWIDFSYVYVSGAMSSSHKLELKGST